MKRCPPRPARFGGVRLRATAAAVLTVAVALGLASAVLLLVLQDNLEKSARAEAAEKAKAVATAVKVAGSPPPPGMPAVAGDVKVTTSLEAPAWKTSSGYVVAGEQVDAQGRRVTIQGRSSLAPTRQAITTLWHLLLPGVPALLLLVALLTWMAVGRALKPVSAIRGKMADITAHDLHQRVPEPGSRDEIAALASARWLPRRPPRPARDPTSPSRWTSPPTCSSAAPATSSGGWSPIWWTTPSATRPPPSRSA